MRHLAPRTEHTTYCEILYCVSISTTYCKRYKQIRCVTLTLMPFYMQIWQSSGFLINVFIIPLTLLMNSYFTITLHIHKIPQRGDKTVAFYIQSSFFVHFHPAFSESQAFVCVCVRIYVYLWL